MSTCYYDHCGWDEAYEQGRLAGIHEEQQRAIAARGVALSRKATDTQQQAALMAFPKSGSLRRLVYEYIKYRWAKGSTDDELEEALGRSHQTISARRRELVIGGHIVDSGVRRKTRRGTSAIVWRLREDATTCGESDPSSSPNSSTTHTGSVGVYVSITDPCPNCGDNHSYNIWNPNPINSTDLDRYWYCAACCHIGPTVPWSQR